MLDLLNLFFSIFWLLIFLSGIWYGVTIEIGDKFSWELYPLKRFFEKKTIKIKRKEGKLLKNPREILKEIGYDNELLNTMSDDDCEYELQEIPYNQ